MKNIVLVLSVFTIFYSCTKNSNVPIEETKTVKDTVINSYIHIHIAEKVKGERKPIFELEIENVRDWQEYTGYFETSDHSQEILLNFETNCACIIKFSDTPGIVIADGIGTKVLDLRFPKKYYITFGKEM